jgi:transcriptional regulator with XRE-family HTH domain
MDMIEKILRLLDEKDMTQSELESAARLAPNRISRWKAGTGEPTASQAVTIARVLDVPVQFLVDDAIESPQPKEDPQLREILDIVRRLGYDTAKDRLIAAPDVVFDRPGYGEMKTERPASGRNKPDAGRRKRG